MLGNVKEGRRVLQHLRRLRHSQSQSAEGIRTAQEEMLKDCLTHAVGKVPYYREVAENLDLDLDLNGALMESFAKMPLLTKDLAKAQFPDRLVPEGLDWEALYSVATSGTTDRVMTFEDEERRNWDRAADLLIEWSGNGFRPGHRSLSFPPDACYEYCGADGRMLTYTVGERFKMWREAPKDQRRQAARQLRSKLMSEYVWRSRRLPSLGVDGTDAANEILESYCEELQSWKPQVVSGLPVTLYVLAMFALRNGHQFPSVRIVRPNGGKFSEVMIEVVERAFGARVRENYGSAELSTTALDCVHCREQHLLGEIHYLECLRDGVAVEPGEVGEFVLTDMRNRITPLIRYTIGDVGRLSSGSCACGFEGTRFVVDGRMEETVVTPAGRAIPGSWLVDLFLRRPEIDHVKIIQKSDVRFLIEAVPSPEGQGLPEADDLARNLSKLLKHEVEIKLRKVRRIAPERNGKYRLVVSNSYQQFHRLGPGSAEGSSAVIG